MAVGWSWPGSIRNISIFLALAGSVLENGAAQNITQPADTATSGQTTCPVKSAGEIQAAIFQYPVCLETHRVQGQEIPVVSTQHHLPVENDTAPIDSDSVTAPEGTADASSAQNADFDQDTDSLLDSSSFLSFEDWKKQNLAKVGQSAENVGGSRRSGAAGKEGRRQPGINNALDSLGDDAEIELDFGGFGAETPEASPTAWGTPIPSQYADQMDGAANGDARTQSVPQPDVSRRKDAGTTCKERFNYASFDCAATVLKTNPECKGSSSVLVENKDSYMLNECRAQNKFLILELCDDILVDTVVLANYEFFSSIFHTFRVSVSDRYPAKPDQWKELGVYEARNTREVQAFAVENSLIWARYLRIEFLTHYGHEFYCPVSLIRVHGTTMLEEYKHDESVSRNEHEAIETVETAEIPDLETEQIEPPVPESIPESKDSTFVEGMCPNPLSEVISLLKGDLPQALVETCDIHEILSVEDMLEKAASTGQTSQLSNANPTITTGGADPATHAGSPVPPKAPKPADDIRRPGDSSKMVVATSDASAPATESAQQNSTIETPGKSTTNSREEPNSAPPVPPPESVRPTSTQPPASNPTTQESFFKSVHKRLQMLESNSTLSLLYIEEQSRILRDAFNKVEKRQLAKTSTFLENLNITVLSELKEFREQYDLVWKSVAFEFEHQRMRYHQEVHSLSGQLGVLADELVFQKRVTVIQSVMVLCCFALVLFSRGSVGNYMEFPRVQRMVARSYSLRSSSPVFVSPSASPGSTRPASSYRETSGHRRNLSDSSSQDSPQSPTVAYIPPTPTSDASQEMQEQGDKPEEPRSPDSMSVPTLETPQFRSQSTPPVLPGHTMDLELEREGNDTIIAPVDPPMPSYDEPPRTS
ncbi:hypothetical protein N7462_003533 [Penicillium macrosclerotiorum]|uniref:uncharacterized protein n=1 Tax=Penicillium macrosclerotiorum TaxID=303699 RepID=UPI0025496ACE|nr:uncharacterized protein N7462_003533 [Penicillium macrosclerotiorum]KAJ5689141.1 hypothetical protein N7462_003533 [Penicillium macrosclerotiorum]